MDRLVPYEQGRSLTEALHRAGAIAELHTIEGADHCFWGVDGSSIMPTVIGFLNRHLQEQAVAATAPR